MFLGELVEDISVRIVVQEIVAGSPATGYAAHFGFVQLVIHNETPFRCVVFCFTSLYTDDLPPWPPLHEKDIAEIFQRKERKSIDKWHILYYNTQAVKMLL